MVPEIALDHAGTAHMKMSFDLALLGKSAPLRVGQQEVDADRRPAR